MAHRHATWLATGLLFLCITATLGSSDTTSRTRQGSRRALQQTTVSASTAFQPVTTVYHSGLASGWRSASYGCNCNFADTVGKMNRSSSSIKAAVSAWGAIVLEADNGFSANSVLDIFVKGSGITSVSFYLEDTKTRTYSKNVVFSNPATVTASTTPITVISSDSDGWIHMQVALNSLVNDLATSTSITSVTTKSSLTVMQWGSWNRLVFKDVSGTGYNLQIDDIKIISLTSGFTIAGQTDFGGLNLTATPDSGMLNLPMLPVFNLDTASSAPMRYIMKLKPNATMFNIKNICQELGSGLNTARFAGACDPAFPSIFNLSMPDMSTLGWGFQSFKVNSIVDLNAMRLSLGSAVEYFERDLDVKIDDITTNLAQTVSPTAAATPSSTTNSANNGFFATILDANVRSWGIDRLDQTNLPLDGVYSPGDLDGSNVHVYVLDTGIRWSHVDFANRVGEGTSFVSSSYWDDHGHGTHASGIAVGAVHGVAKKAIVHAVKVLDSTGSGSYSNIISGLGWVKNHVKNNGFRSAVVSLSLGGPRAASLNDAVQDLVNNGIPVVVAAGNNNGGDACSYSPASLPDAITVGATDNNDQRSSFSNIGSCLYIFGPGSSITSASNQADTAETVMSGTSMACPHAAGVVAMYLQYAPGSTISQIKAALDRAAVKIAIDSSSPNRLLNAMSSRLKPPSTPATSTPTTSTPTTSTPTTSTPTTSTPTTSTPTTSTPSTGGISFPSFGGITFPSWGSTPTTNTPTTTTPTTNTPTATNPPATTPTTNTPTTTAPSTPTTTNPPASTTPVSNKPSWCSSCSWCLFCS